MKCQHQLALFTNVELFQLSVGQLILFPSEYKLTSLVLTSHLLLLFSLSKFLPWPIFTGAAQLSSLTALYYCVHTAHPVYLQSSLPWPVQCSTDPACPKQLVSNFNILSFVVKWRERRTRQSVIKNFKRRHFILIIFLWLSPQTIDLSEVSSRSKV